MMLADVEPGWVTKTVLATLMIDGDPLSCVFPLGVELGIAAGVVCGVVILALALELDSSLLPTLAVIPVK